MARIIYSALVTKISGSIGGTTFQSNKHGFTVKAKSNIVRPNSLLQNIRKIYFSAAVKYWNQLTTTQKDAYNTYASTRPQYAKNNPSSELSGFNIFVKWHALNYLKNADISANLPVISGSYSTVDNPTLVINKSVTPLYFTGTYALNTDTHDCMYFISRPFRPGENFVGSNLRYLAYTGNDSFGIDIQFDYVNLWGVMPIIGDRLFIKVVQIERTQPFVFAGIDYPVTIIS